MNCVVHLAGVVHGALALDAGEGIAAGRGGTELLEDELVLDVLDKVGDDLWVTGGEVERAEHLHLERHRLRRGWGPRRLLGLGHRARVGGLGLEHIRTTNNKLDFSALRTAYLESDRLRFDLAGSLVALDALRVEVVVHPSHGVVGAREVLVPKHTLQHALDGVVRDVEVEGLAAPAGVDGPLLGGGLLLRLLTHLQRHVHVGRLCELVRRRQVVAGVDLDLRAVALLDDDAELALAAAALQLHPHLALFFREKAVQVDVRLSDAGFLARDDLADLALDDLVEHAELEQGLAGVAREDELFVPHGVDLTAPRRRRVLEVLADHLDVRVRLAVELVLGCLRAGQLHTELVVVEVEAAEDLNAEGVELRWGQLLLRRRCVAGSTAHCFRGG
eukprot:PhM_4_TR14155/c2_g2_i1/m.51653